MKSNAQKHHIMKMIESTNINGAINGQMPANTTEILTSILPKKIEVRNQN